MGDRTSSFRGLDIVTLRDGKQISVNQERALIQPVDIEIYEALKSLGDNKAPSIEVYNPKFFKHAWKVVGEDVKNVVHDFLEIIDCISQSVAHGSP